MLECGNQRLPVACSLGRVSCQMGSLTASTRDRLDPRAAEVLSEPSLLLRSRRQPLRSPQCSIPSRRSASRSRRSRRRLPRSKPTRSRLVGQPCAPISGTPQTPNGPHSPGARAVFRLRGVPRPTTKSSSPPSPSSPRTATHAARGISPQCIRPLAFRDRAHRPPRRIAPSRRGRR